MKKKNKEALKLRRQFTKQFYKKNMGRFFISLTAAILLALGNLAVSGLIQMITDAASGSESQYSLGQLTFICIAVVFGIVFALQLEYHTTPRFITKAMEQYKNYAFQEIAKKSISSFSEENASTYISALSNDVNSIETNYLSKIFKLVQESIMFVGAFGMMLYYSPRLTLAAVLFSLLPVLASVLTGNRLAKEEKAVSDKNESFLAAVKDMLSGFSVIKSFKAEKEVSRIFEESNRKAEAAKCQRKKTEVLLQTIGFVAGVTAQFGVFIIGAWLALRGEGVTAGVIIVFVQLMNYVITPIGEIPQILANRKAANALIDKLAAAVSANVRMEGQRVKESLNEAIELKNVTFGYEKDTEVLHNVNMTFEAGKSYAIVGGSGSGKSTVLNLLMGSREDYKGEILFDSQELRTISSDSLYELASIVQQNVFVFNSSIRDNITMFREFAEEKIERAVEMSGLRGLLEKKGESYLCGENGSGLSGGERQRISIARCILRDTPVMLVDEATAALDAETAVSVTKSILDISGLTRIIVTHRLEESLMQKYDGIFVLRNGKVEEMGKFEELMEKKGYFYSLFEVSQ